MSLPLISVVIPNYNRGHLLQEVLKSVISQTYSNWEIIVVDDFSTDDSLAVLKQLQEQIPQLIVHQLAENSGANVCRNKGVELAKGELIAFLDSDDYFLPSKLEKQELIFRKYPEVGFVVTGFGSTAIHVPSEGLLYVGDTILQNNLGGFSTLMVKKSLFLQIGGLDNSLLSCQDWDLFLKLLEVSKGYKISEDLVVYEIQDDSISKNSNKVIQGYQVVSKRAAEINSRLKLVPERKLASYQEYYLALRYYGLRDIGQVRHHLWQSLRIQPTPLAAIYLVVSWFGWQVLHNFINFKNKLKNNLGNKTK
ncbi:TPA: glycosyltransferase family 2 protein [Streptococcus suis]